jgi:AraC-like DNA-binding protein
LTKAFCFVKLATIEAKGVRIMIPQISIIDIIRFKREHFCFKTENKACYVLTCRIRGESLFFCNGEEFLAKRGDVLYIPTGSSYTQSCEEETLICFHLNISGQALSDMALFSVQDPQKMCELFERAERLWREKPTNYEFLCMSLLYEIISNVHIFPNERPQHAASILKPAIEYLDEHLFDAALSWELVCKQAHISRTYFNKLFLQTYACTPTAYANEKRIERAKQFLNSGGFSNEEIASLCGFRDVKYFYVIFKKLTGYTTKEYKRRMEIYSAP